MSSSTGDPPPPPSSSGRVAVFAALIGAGGAIAAAIIGPLIAELLQDGEPPGPMIPSTGTPPAVAAPTAGPPGPVSVAPTVPSSATPMIDTPMIDTAQFLAGSRMVVVTDGAGFPPGSAVSLYYFLRSSSSFPLGGAVRVDPGGRFRSEYTLPDGVNYCSTFGSVVAFVDSSDRSIVESPLTLTC